MIFDFMHALQCLWNSATRKYLIAGMIASAAVLALLYATLTVIYSTPFIVKSFLAQPFSTIYLTESEGHAQIVNDRFFYQENSRLENQQRQLSAGERLDTIQEGREYKLWRDMNAAERAQAQYRPEVISMTRPRVVWLTFILFSPLAPVFAFTFIARAVASRVEAEYYQHLEPVEQDAPVWSHNFRFIGIILLANLPLSLLYLKPPWGYVAILATNGYLIGRWCFNTIAFRRLSEEITRKLRRPNYLRVWLAGVAIAGLFYVPVVNLVAPLFAAGLMTHLFERLRNTARNIEVD